jgi:hypothetical protein
MFNFLGAKVESLLGIFCNASNGSSGFFGNPIVSVLGTMAGLAVQGYIFYWFVHNDKYLLQ